MAKKKQVFAPGIHESIAPAARFVTPEKQQNTGDGPDNPSPVGICRPEHRYPP